MLQSKPSSEKSIQGAEKYIAYFEHLSLETCADVKALVTENIYFHDPYNEVTGKEIYPVKCMKKSYMIYRVLSIPFMKKHSVEIGYIYTGRFAEYQNKHHLLLQKLKQKACPWWFLINMEK